MKSASLGIVISAICGVFGSRDGCPLRTTYSSGWRAQTHFRRRTVGLPALALICANFAVLGTDSKAAANELSSAIFYGQAAANINAATSSNINNVTTTPGSVSAAPSFEGTSINEGVSISSYPSPNISAGESINGLTFTLEGGTTLSGTTTGQVNYSLEVVGNPSSTLVPVTIDATMGYTVSVYGRAQISTASNIGITTGGGTGVANIYLDSPLVGDDGQFTNIETTTSNILSGPFLVDLSPNVTYDVALSVYIAGTAITAKQCGMPPQSLEYCNLGGNAAATAYLDPVFTVSDPNYSIELSPDIGNSPTVAPLPATLPLFFTGLGAMGLLGFRRKRTAVTRPGNLISMC